MNITSQRSSPCVEFALIDAKDPNQVARFMFWLDRGRWPEQEQDDFLLSLAEAKDINMDDLLEITWMFDAPRHRILKLLWQLLQDNNSEEHFWNKFTIGLAEFAQDAAKCRERLPVIQERLRWVLQGVEEVGLHDIDIGQGNWGEDWFMSQERATYVRSQLSKVHFDILEKSSDYEEMLQTVMEFTVTNRAQVIDIPFGEQQRYYVGEVQETNFQSQMCVWVEIGSRRQGLVNVDRPWRGVPGYGFGWGYGGSGPRVLASSLLADATGGDIAIAERYWTAFRNDVVEHLPYSGQFRLTRKEVLDWLLKQGIGQKELARYQKELQKRRCVYEPILARLRVKLDKIASMGGLRAQRFDYVPEDFECALYVDLMEMLKRGKRILRCARCSWPISYDGSSKSNRQRARWESGRPIYHYQCFHETTIERKRAYWQKRMSDPTFKEQRRYDAKRYRCKNSVQKLVKQGEGQSIEFKTSFAEQNEAIISLGAFTHADGGTVLFGVNNNGSIVGVALGSNTLEHFVNTLRTYTQPPLTVSVEQITIGGKIVVTVNVGKARPGQLFYVLNRPYIRVSKTNQVMTPEEQRVRLRQPNPL